jgi:Kef-type K+ transport system membrane component KefB
VRTIITLALFLVVGFIGSRGFVSRATHRLPMTGLFATGMEFFLLGIVLGPSAFDLITADVLQDLEPIVFLMLGWIGLLFGVELSWDHVKKISGAMFRFLLAETLAFVVVFSAGSYLVIGWAWPGMAATDRAVGAFLFGITAAISSPTVIAVVTQRLPARGPLTNTLRVAGALSALFPLLAFGLLFMILSPRFMGVDGIGYGLLWWLFVNAVGLVLGFLMVLFTRERTSDNEMLLLIAGTVLLIGGLCYFLGLSSLYTAMVMGVVVGNFSRKREQIFRELHHIEKTLFLGFLIVVGATVDLDRPLVIAAVTAAYVTLRLAMKFVVTGSALAASFPDLGEHGRRAGLALSAQGVMAMAIALDCTLASRGHELASTLTVVAVAVLVNDVAGFAVTRRLMQWSGEVVRGRKGVG